MESDESSLSTFPAITRLPILWGDMDAYQHVNNAVYLRWFESSRIHYIEQAGIRSQLDTHALGPILASVTCHYKRQLRYPGLVDIGSKVSRLGRSSLTVQHRILNVESGDIAAEGESVVVVFDFDKQRPRRIPTDIRESILAFEGSNTPVNSPLRRTDGSD